MRQCIKNCSSTQLFNFAVCSMSGILPLNKIIFLKVKRIFQKMCQNNVTLYFSKTFIKFLPPEYLLKTYIDYAKEKCDINFFHRFLFFHFIAFVTLFLPVFFSCFLFISFFFYIFFLPPF